MQYQVCPDFGSNLDHGERCECREEQAAAVEGDRIHEEHLTHPATKKGERYAEHLR